MHHDLEVLLEQGSHLRRFEAEHRGVGRQRSGTDTEHHPSSGEVVEQDHPFGHPQRVVVRQRHHAGPQFDVPRSFGRRHDEDLR